MTDKIDTVEEAAAWIYKHDGRIDAWWDAQHQLNKDNSERFLALEARILSLEHRVIWASGLAAGIGGLLGPLITLVVKGS